MDGSIRTVNWDRLIQNWPIEERLHLALTCAFHRSDYLYGNRWDLLFSDPEILPVIRAKFSDLAEQPLIVDTHALDGATIGVQNNPFPFPHTDSTIYKRRLYVSDQLGVFGASCDARGGRLRYPVSTRPTKIWDAEALSIAANYDTLALAGGEEGLFEVALTSSSRPWDEELYEDEAYAEPSALSSMDCNRCGWNYYSICASSNSGPSYLVDFNLFEYKRGPGFEGRREQRAVLKDEEIFGTHGYTWGRQEKIYQVINSTIKVARYSPWETDERLRIETIDQEVFSHPKGEPITAGVSLFGTVIEWDEGLQVITSNAESIWIPGEPVNWRVFPRSKHYENQLHVLYEDRLEIFSFNHDYFVDQEKKKFGLKFSERT
jgi:hypothetical protein